MAGVQHMWLGRGVARLEKEMQFGGRQIGADRLTNAGLSRRSLAKEMPCVYLKLTL